MNNKALKKQLKRTHTKAAVEVQLSWIAQALGLSPASRKEKDRLFSLARAIKEGQIHGAS